jgi:hypothetical protein
MWSIVFANLSPRSEHENKQTLSSRKTDCLSPRERFPTALCVFRNRPLPALERLFYPIETSGRDPKNNSCRCPQSELETFELKATK